MKGYFLIALCCILIACARPTAVSFTAGDDGGMANAQPREVVETFWKTAIAGNSAEIEGVVSGPPDSFWIQCEPGPDGKTTDGNKDRVTSVSTRGPDHLGEYSLKTDSEILKEWSEGYLRLVRNTAVAIQKGQLRQSGTVSERQFGDEATVRVPSTDGRAATETVFYLTKTGTGWKIFLVDNDTTRQPVEMTYAAKRPTCGPTIDGNRTH